MNEYLRMSFFKKERTARRREAAKEKKGSLRLRVEVSLELKKPSYLFPFFLGVPLRPLRWAFFLEEFEPPGV